MKVKAIYRKLRPNPFVLIPTQPVIRADVPNNMAWEEIVKFAKEATPKDHEFVEVIKEEETSKPKQI